jgi:hypothetical protein
MTSHTYSRALPYLALVLLPLGAGCFENHTVGSDVADAATGKDAASCPAVEECSEPPIPEGCHLGAGSCVDGVYTCPEVVCPGTDASVGCVHNNMVCNLPPIPSGCSLGPSTCVDGIYQCPSVVCPDASAGCANDNMVCSEPPIPSGCSLGPSTCVDGLYQCPAVVCPDGGAADATGPHSFACGSGSLTCDSTTDYCWVVAGGPISPDGGTSESSSCLALPASCTGADATCACLKALAAGVCTVTGSGITLTEDAP